MPVDFADLPACATKAMIMKKYGQDGVDAMQAQQAALAMPYLWKNPAKLPRRPWLFGYWLLRGEVTALIAPGGAGKSTITAAIALSLATGRPLIGKNLPRGCQRAWLYNLEDSPDELDRQMAAATTHYGITPADCEDRLWLTSGLVKPLITAKVGKNAVEIDEYVFSDLTATIKTRGIDVLIIDPLVSSHEVSEASNEAIDAIVKRWKKLAHETGCAIVLVHHTRKLGGREVTAEDGRGAIALRDAARVVLTLNRATKSEAEAMGVADPDIQNKLIRVDTGKANRSPLEAATWIKLESQCLENGTADEPADFVGVATLWKKPDTFHGVTPLHLHRVQELVADGSWRENHKAENWVGKVIADVLGLSLEKDMQKIRAIQKFWTMSGALQVQRLPDSKGVKRPFITVGKPVDPVNLGLPHTE
jgi:hypothetical protein